MFTSMLGLAPVPLRFRLRELLEEKGVSQSELARLSGVSFTTINRMAANHTAQVSLGTLDKLSDALGVGPGELFEREGQPRLRGRRGG